MNIPYWVVPIPLILIIFHILFSVRRDHKNYEYVLGENRRIHRITRQEEILCEFPPVNYWDRKVTRWVKIRKEERQEDE